MKMTEKEIQPIAIDGKIIDFKTKEVIEDLDKGINTFKVIETIIHDDKRIYELTKNDIGYYNFKGEKLLAHLICNELNRLIEKNKVLYKEIMRLKTQNNDLLFSNANNMEVLKKENKEIKTVLNEVLDQLYSAESGLIHEYSTNITEDEKELQEHFKSEYGKYGWKE